MDTCHLQYTIAVPLEAQASRGGPKCGTEQGLPPGRMVVVGDILEYPLETTQPRQEILSGASFTVLGFSGTDIRHQSKQAQEQPLDERRWYPVEQGGAFGASQGRAQRQ